MNDHLEPECPNDISEVFTDDLDDHFETPHDIQQAIKDARPLPPSLKLLTHNRPAPILRRVK